MNGHCQSCGLAWGQHQAGCTQNTAIQSGAEWSPWPQVAIDAAERRIMAKLDVLEKKLNSLTKSAKDGE